MTESARPESAPPSAADRLSAAYAQTEAVLSAASEKLVGSEAFAEFLAFTTGNALAVVRIANDTADSVVRNLRLAGRRDVTRLAGQLARTEDKLERLLQEVRELRASIEDRTPQADRTTKKSAAQHGRGSSSAPRAGAAAAAGAARKSPPKKIARKAAR